jgi:hypothetical protein
MQTHLAVSMAVMLSAAAGAQEGNRRTISGTVTDSAGNVLPFVNISVGSARTVTTDAGRYVVRVARGPLKLEFRRLGFAPVDTALLAGQVDTSFAIVMRPLAQRLSAVEVVGTNSSRKLELRGFYDRMRDVERGINRGYFITPEDLEARKPNYITQMTEGFPSIRVDALLGQEWAVIVGTGRCKMTVYLDGVRIVGSLNPRADGFVNQLVQPNQIAGVEVYPRNVGAPPQYQSLNGSCGVVLIWTK